MAAMHLCRWEPARALPLGRYSRSASGRGRCQRYVDYCVPVARFSPSAGVHHDAASCRLAAVAAAAVGAVAAAAVGAVAAARMILAAADDKKGRDPCADGSSNVGKRERLSKVRALHE